MADEKINNKADGKKQQSADLAYIDDLTSLHNRRYLNKVLMKEISRAKNENKNISVFMMDCDNLKDINDSCGHLNGDKVLIRIADILREQVAGDDTVVRYAGDEFTVVLFDKGLDGSLVIAGRILKLVNENKIELLRGRKFLKMTVSIGIAVYPDDADNASGLLDRADQALYSAKRSGKNRVSTVRDILTEVKDRDLVVNALPCRQFIDRTRELEHVQDAYEAAEKGDKRLILVKGAEGTGKTRFILELFSPDRIYPSLLLMCSRESSDEQFHSISDAFNGYLEFMDADQVLDALNALSDINKFAMISMVQKLRDLPVKFSGSENFSRRDLADEDIIRAFLIFLRELKVKVVPVLADDILWIDKGSLEIIRRTINEPGAAWGVLVVGGIAEMLTDVRLAPKTPFSEFINERNIGKLVENIDLKTFNEENISAFFKAIFQEDIIPMEFTNKVFKVTKGIPVRLEWFVRRMFANRIVSAKGGRWVFNPEEFDKMISFQDYRGPENRTYMRLHTDCAVDYVRLSDDLKPAYNVVEDSYSKNISASGVKFVSSEHVPAGSFLELRIRIPTTDRPIAAIGKVLRCEKEGIKNFTVALSFIWISNRDRELVDEYVRNR